MSSCNPLTNTSREVFWLISNPCVYNTRNFSFILLRRTKEQQMFVVSKAIVHSYAVFPELIFQYELTYSIPSMIYQKVCCIICSINN